MAKGPSGSTSPPPATAMPSPTTLDARISCSCSITRPRHVFRNRRIGTYTSAQRPFGEKRNACHRSSFWPVIQFSVRMDATYLRPSENTRYRSAVNASRSRYSPAGRSKVEHPAKPERRSFERGAVASFDGCFEKKTFREFAAIAASRDSYPDLEVSSSVSKDSGSSGSSFASSPVRRFGEALRPASVADAEASSRASNASGALVLVLSTPRRNNAPGLLPTSLVSEATPAAHFGSLVSPVSTNVTLDVDVPPCGASDQARHLSETHRSDWNDATISLDALTGETSCMSRARRAARRAQLRSRDAMRRGDSGSAASRPNDRGARSPPCRAE